MSMKVKTIGTLRDGGSKDGYIIGKVCIFDSGVIFQMEPDQDSVFFDPEEAIQLGRLLIKAGERILGKVLS